MLSGLAIEVGFDPGPILIAPRLFGLGDQVLRDAAMRQNELRATIRRWCQRDRGHREDAFGESAGTRSTLTPVTSFPLAENVPPIFLLMVAFLPVTAVCFRESASSS